MKTRDFYFDLPQRLIAQHPPEQRGRSRLMVLDRLTGKRSHRMVDDLPEILCGPAFRAEAGLPLLVFNNSKVRKARLIGKSEQTGANVEFLLLERTDKEQSRRKEQNLVNCSLLTAHCSLTWKVLVPRAKRRKPGSRYVFYDKDGNEIARAEILPQSPVPSPYTPHPTPRTLHPAPYTLLQFDRPIDDDWLDRYGHIPLPPYIKRQDAPDDADRYQTVYAAAYGSSAAPTAGLHFTNELLERIAAAGIETAYVTLHVGLGTFLPVRTENIEDHAMHEEAFSIDERTAVKIETAKAEGRKVIAVGTTSVRSLESAHAMESVSVPESAAMEERSRAGWKLRRGEGRTAMYIYPGYRFNIVDALFTNFHTPESTLLMLVSAFAGREFILDSYAEAIRENYRFFSYGDAMLVV